MPRTSYDAPKTHARPSYWGDDAACKDGGATELFFPVSYEGVHQLEIAEAKAICRGCPVAGSCLHAALERREPEGVWGGLDPDERKALLAALKPDGTGEAPDASP